MAKGYRVEGFQGVGSRIAWEALNHEYTDLYNEHLLTDLSKFIGLRGDWPTVLQAFRDKHGDATGIWLTREKKDAKEYYGMYGGVFLECEYEPRNVISDLGPDGIFVLDPGDCLELEELPYTEDDS